MMKIRWREAFWQLAIWVAAVASLAVARLAFGVGPVDVVPARIGEGAISLNGDWRFRYIPSLDAGSAEKFFEPAYDISEWKSIPVPGHWELHGFAEPKYASDVDQGLGLYRRTFHAPPRLRGQKVFLRFDGVLFGFTAFINGHEIGEWASGFNPVTFEITDLLRPEDEENVLAVRVTTRSKGWDFDTMDCWGISGIFRDVTMFALPACHLQDYTLGTELTADGAAEVSIRVQASAAGNVKGSIRAPGGEVVREFAMDVAGDGRGATKLKLDHPQLWTAETPALYALELELRSIDGSSHRLIEKVGLRQITIDDGILKLNGQPIKLRGVDHHDIWPAEGRVATEELLRRDLSLMRDAHINFIRTSHYPPHPRLIELCDELGFYVDCEVPFIHGRQNLKNPAYQEALQTRAKATVQRDKNRPSVILWSVGNENNILPANLNVGKLVKELDPSRPITLPTIGSYFKDNYEKLPSYVDLYSPHYPGADAVKSYAEKLTRPIVVTEYAHQRGIARGGASVQDIWEAMYRAPRVAGGAVWLFQDQGILRTAENRNDVENWDQMVWLDEHRYFDTRGFFAVDGIVYSDRTPQIDYWQLRKVYSPIQIPERAFSLPVGADEITLHVENRFDFSSLQGYLLRWKVCQNSQELHHGEIPLHAAPHATQEVAIPVPLPQTRSGEVLTLELNCVDESGRGIYERAWRLDEPGGCWAALRSAIAPSQPALDLSDSLIKVRHPTFQLIVDRATGQSSLQNGNGREVLARIGPHTGRVLTINDLGKQREGEQTHWRGELLTDVKNLSTSAINIDHGVTVTVAGEYPRPGFPEEFVRGQYRLFCTERGVIEVEYAFEPVNASGSFVETGLALAAPAALSEFRWIGQGPYASYRGKDRLAEFGLFHLNREDLYFPGNRRGVELALLSLPSGAGILAAGDAMTVSVDRADEVTYFSHVASGIRPASDKTSQGENVENKSEVKAGSIKKFSGKFELLVLSDSWPAPLSNWFGPTSQPARLTKRFAHSYDE